jgi:hypothetical protein
MTTPSSLFSINIYKNSVKQGLINLKVKIQVTIILGLPSCYIAYQDYENRFVRAFCNLQNKNR